MNTKLLLVLLLAFFVIIEYNGLDHYDLGDENIYFYMGKLVSEGKMPYKDFFFAHPPAQVFFNGIVFKLFGFNLVLLKLIPLIATLISAFLLFRLAREKFDDLTALFSIALFLFTYNIMLESTYAIGVNLTTMFVVAGVYLLFRKRVILSGLSLGLAGLTGLYSLIPSFIIFVYLLVKDRKKFINLAIGFSLSFGLVNLSLLILYKDKFFLPVYLYHFLKPKLEGNRLSVFFEIIKNNYLIFLSAASILFIKQKNKLEIFLYITIAYIIFLLFLNKIFNFYFVLLFPFLAIIGGYSLNYFYEKFKKPFLILFIVLLAINSFFSAKYLSEFDFSDFESLDPIKRFIEYSSDKDDFIFGDDSVTPLFALMTERRIAFDMVDTNDMRFLSGTTDLDEVIIKIREDKIKLVLVRPLYGIGRLPQFWQFVNEECKLVYGINDKYWSDILVFDCS